MIQDIAPARFDGAYRLSPPADGDTVCIFHGPRILCAVSPTGVLTLPRFCELPVSAENCRRLFSVDRQTYFCCRRTLTVLDCDYHWLPLRRALSCTPQETAFAAVTAYHLASWYASNRFCGRCGQAMAPHSKERALVCSRCGQVVYPRINPAVIVGVTDGDRLLVTKYAPSHASAKVYALIAGFCEIGESAEETVRREVLEEVGLQVKNIRYYGSQPWGVDGNLSLGYFADLDGSDAVTLEREELSLAEWVGRADVPQRGNTLALTAEMMEAFRLGRV